MLQYDLIGRVVINFADWMANTGNMNIDMDTCMCCLMRKPTMWFLNRSDTKKSCTITEAG